MLLHTRTTAMMLCSAFLFASTTADNPKSSFSARAIDKNFARVNDNLYACKYETSNADYNAFIVAIAGDNKLLRVCAVDSNSWKKIGSYSEPMVKHYHRHPAYGDYPVVNVSYEAALHYCAWLTKNYNADPKRAFKQVEFVLPSQKEWEEAAMGGRAQAMFPWGRFYLRDKDGAYLCNIRHINEASIVSDDSGNPICPIIKTDTPAQNERNYFTAKKDSFKPNDFGLYNMSGNAAEMIAEKGISKGGSWNNYGGDAHIKAFRRYSGTTPEVGFRVFMRIINK